MSKAPLKGPWYPRPSPKRRWIRLLTLTTTWYVQEAFCFYMPVGLEAVFTMLSFYRGHVFTEKLVDLSVVCKGNICCKSNIVFTDHGILLYYFIHIIFYKLLPRYILMFFVWYCIVSSLLLPNRICPVVDSYLSFASMGWSWWKTTCSMSLLSLTAAPLLFLFL